MDDETLLGVGVTFLGVGSMALALGAFFFARTKRFLRTAVDTTGVVIDVRERHDQDHGTTYSVVVRFQTAAGETIVWNERLSSNPAVGQPGEELPMKYDPQNPHDARIDRTLRLWFAPILIWGLGGLVFVVGAIQTIAALA